MIALIKIEGAEVLKRKIMVSVGEVAVPADESMAFEGLADGLTIVSYTGNLTATKISAHIAQLRADALEALYLSAIGYQNKTIDSNLHSEIQKSESVVESGVLLEADLPMAKACGDWVETLWLDYYTRKAALESDSDYTTDFSNNSVAPSTFAEVRAERKAALSA